MNLEFAILADAAVTTSDGRFSILNGDLGLIEAPSFPTVHPFFAMVVKLSANSDEARSEHKFRAELRGPDGVSIVHPATGTITLRSNDWDVEDYSAGFVISFPLVVFPQEGKYVFHLFVDDIEIKKTVPLHLKRLTPSTQPEATGSERETVRGGKEVGQ
jgi:hypothetical protein